MRPVSVKELAELLNKAIREDKGDYLVVVSDDDECNGTHALWEKKTYAQGEDYEFVENGTRKIRNTIVLQ